MAGKKITRQQVEGYMRSRKNGKTQKIAALQNGFSEKSAHNIDKRGGVEAASKHTWRTRKDPFESVWESEIVSRLNNAPLLQAYTILEELQQIHPGQYPDGLLRTLQRRVRNWRACSGPEREIIFRQKHPPGWQGMSDFTNADCLMVTIQGKILEYLLYHYRLVYSKWEYVSVVLGGESYTALAEGLQNALWFSNGAPKTHRTDSLSAAYKNCSDKAKEAFTENYQALCDHYQMEPTRNNKGVSHENGAIEVSHSDLKNRLDQALMLRGSRDFSSLEDYKQFIRELVQRHNRKIHRAYLEELAQLNFLPSGKTIDYTEERAAVTTSSTINIRGVTYSVPSRLIGMTLKVNLYDDRLHCFIGNDSVAILERKRKNKQAIHQIDYRHVVGALAHKPQAFRHYIYQEDLMPTLAFRQTWERLNEELDSKTACREYVAILREAAVADRESTVNQFLEEQLLKKILPRSEDVRKLFRDQTVVPKLQTLNQNLEGYEALLGGAL